MQTIGGHSAPIFLGDDLRNEWVYQNPQASKPLIVPYDLTCNTSEEDMFRNVLENSKKCDRWVKRLPEHDGVAVVCGSGPSLKESLDEVKRLVSEGAKLFSLNGSAKFLDSNGILPDYQVIMDARPQTAELVGPAKEHLFASQVHPETLAKAKNLTIWHSTYGNRMFDEQEGFPKHHDDYTIIGGAITCGISVLILIYALGYRKVICFGYDSSHKGSESHAFSQPMNNDDPLTLVKFRGKEYISSFTMQAQAKHFAGIAHHLKEGGMQIEVRGYGLLPDIYNANLTEKEKYQEMWKHDEYREVAPGEQCIATFFDVVNPQVGSTVIDFGCGTGKGALLLSNYGLKVTLIDFADNSRNIEARSLPFIEADLTELPEDLKSDYGYCTDVMEHIPPDKVETVIKNLLRASGRVFFQISLVPDSLGALIGQELHLSVHSYQWWIDTFVRLGYSVTWSEDQEYQALYYVTSTPTTT